MTGKGWVNGTDIVSKPYNKAYAEGWERIFGKDKDEDIVQSPEMREKVLDYLDGNPTS